MQCNTFFKTVAARFRWTCFEWGQEIFAHLFIVACADISLGRDRAVISIPSSKGIKKNFLQLERLELTKQKDYRTKVLPWYIWIVGCLRLFN